MIGRVVRTWADDAARFADVLVDQDPSWKSEHFPLAGGHVVLCGAGMYINQAIGVGVDGALSPAEWMHFEERCEAVGVPPSFELSPATAEAVREQVVGRGYRPDGERSALVRGLDDVESLPDPDPALVIEPADGELLSLWQVTSAAGWGHVAPAALRASDAFARAAAVVDGDRLVLVRDARDGRPVGCASLTVSDGIATLGGMSTMPNERGRGVQSALIVHRLRAARALGCEIVTSTTVPGGVSERNLRRHGFERRFILETHTA